MYGNNYGRGYGSYYPPPGEYAPHNPPQYGYAGPPSQWYAQSPPAQMVPAYSSATPRSVYRHVTAPHLFETGEEAQRRRLADRFVPRHNIISARGAPGYYHSGTPLVPDPFYLRPRQADQADSAFDSDELSILHAAGFDANDRGFLAGLPDRQFAFVMTNGELLAHHGFSPVQIFSIARLAPSERTFVSRHVGELRQLHFYPEDIRDLAIMSSRRRDFILDHGRQLLASGMSPLQMRRLSTRPAAERNYVVEYGGRMRNRGSSVADIMRQARQSASRPLPQPVESTSRRRSQLIIEPAYRAAGIEPVRRPAPPLSSSPEQQVFTPPPRRHTTQAQSSRLSSDERQTFESMGLSQQAMERLARSNSTVRTYMLEHGGSLLASGLALDEIFQMAEDITPSRPRSSRRQERSEPQRRRTAPVPDLDGMFSYLTVDDIAATQQAQPQVQPTPVSHPRNNQPFNSLQQEKLDHAARRWAPGRVRNSNAENFYRETVPQALLELMAADNGHPNLHLLLAGVPYAEDNRHTTSSDRHKRRVKALTDYMINANAPDLLADCDAAAAEGVTHCGDRVAYGLTRVEQVIMQRRIEHGEIPPSQIFMSIESIFLQPRIENVAAHLANARKVRNSVPATSDNFTTQSFARQVEDAVRATFRREIENGPTGIVSPLISVLRSTFFGTPAATNTSGEDNSARESLEMYAALTPQLVQRGVNLVESAQSSTYGGMYRIEPLELEYAMALVNRHVRDMSPEFLEEFEGNSAVERVLRQCFQSDWRDMCAEREAMQEQADDALFDENAPSGTQETVQDVMTALATMEKDWYRDKLQFLLPRRHLLENMPPMAADLEEA
jgi:hypothetical protein